MDLSDGFRLVSVKSDNIVDKVRSQIGSEPNLAETSDSFDLALVDSSSQVQLLISIDDGKVVSFLGRDKSAPSRHLVSLLAPFFRHSGFRAGFDNTVAGFVINADGRPVDIFDMPNGLRIPGDLNLRYSTLKSLPDGLHVDGSLDVSHSDMEYLGIGLRVEGSMDISYTEVFNLPVDLHVGGDLLAHASRIRQLSDGLQVAGTAYFTASSLSLIGYRSHFGSLVATDSALRKIPTDIVVDRDLDISRTLVRVLPPGLRIGGSLRASNTAIQEIPSMFRAGGDLDVSKTPLWRIGDSVIVGGRLVLNDTRITRLPFDTVFAEAHLIGTKISYVPFEIPDEVVIIDTKGRRTSASSYRQTWRKWFLHSVLLVPV